MHDLHLLLSQAVSHASWVGAQPFVLAAGSIFGEFCEPTRDMRLRFKASWRLGATKTDRILYICANCAWCDWERRKRTVLSLVVTQTHLDRACASDVHIYGDYETDRSIVVR